MATNDLEELLAQQPSVAEVTINAIRKKALQARDLEAQIQALEERIKQHRAELHNITRVELPAMMDKAQTDSVGIPAIGNWPAYDVKLCPYYKANIAAAWPEEKRLAAFAALTNLGAGDLIKTEITLALPKEDRANAANVIQALHDLGYHPNIKENVNHQTLTSWLREQLERGNPIPELNTIGADVGRVVKLTERKEANHG